jgi:CARDB
MSEHDSDIEFDFFDEPETGESAPPPGRQRSQRPPGPPPPQKPPRRGLPPAARLAGLIAFGILIVVLLVLWVQSCSGTSTKSSYENYLGKVQVLAHDSNQIATSLNQAIATPGITSTQLASKMDTLAARQQSDVEEAQKLNEPRQLSAPQQSMVEALQFRVSGIKGLSQALRTGAGSTKTEEAASALALQGERLVASDVIWEDKFRQPTIASMSQQGITGLVAPVSHFAEDGIDSQAFWNPVVQRLNGNSTSGGTTSGGLVGTELLGVTVLPKGTALSPTNLNTITESTNLGFVVSVKNSGDVQVASVQVTITLKQTPHPITQTKTIPLINPGATATATFKNLPQPVFVVKTTLEVDVKPVPGETHVSNNSASYQVIFSYG